MKHAARRFAAHVCEAERESEAAEKVKEKWLLPEGSSKIQPINLRFTALLTCNPSRLSRAKKTAAACCYVMNCPDLLELSRRSQLLFRVRTAHREATLNSFALLIWNKLEEN